MLWLLVSGMLGRRDRSVAVVAVLAAGEGAVFLANDGECPLTPLAERPAAERGSISGLREQESEAPILGRGPRMGAGLSEGDQAG